MLTNGQTPPMENRSHKIELGALSISLGALAVFAIIGVAVGSLVWLVVSNSELGKAIPLAGSTLFLIIVFIMLMIGIIVCVRMFSTHTNNASLDAQANYHVSMSQATHHQISAWNLLPPAVRQRYLPPAIKHAMVLFESGKVKDVNLNDPHSMDWQKLVGPTQPQPPAQVAATPNYLPPSSGESIEDDPEIDEDGLTIPAIARKNYVTVTNTQQGKINETVNELMARRIALANMVSTRCRNMNPSVSNIKAKLGFPSELIRSNDDVTAAQTILGQRGEARKCGEAQTSRWLWIDPRTGNPIDYGRGND